MLPSCMERHLHAASCMQALAGMRNVSTCLWCHTCRVDVALPSVEVRFEGLHIETEVYAETSRQLPSLFNAVRGLLEARPQCSHLFRHLHGCMLLVHHPHLADAAASCG